MKKKVLCLAFAFLGFSGLLFGQTYDVLKFGAKPGGKTLCTQAIQAAIDSAASRGGGRIVIPAGKFLTGSIVLRDNIDLHLARGAVLLGSTALTEYRKNDRNKRWYALILADEAHNVSVTGNGVIDGRGRTLALSVDSLFYAGRLDSSLYSLRHNRPNEQMRPQIIEMSHCSNIQVSGITLKNAAGWVQTYDMCEKLTIKDIRVESDAYWNNDGIDISDCRGVRITGCSINSADDGICLKSHSPGQWVDSVYISDCEIRSSASAVKFGTASLGGFRNVRIQNIRVFDTFRSAIALESVDGGTLEHIDIYNVHAVNTGNGIFIRLGHRNTNGAVGALRDITIRKVYVEIPFDRPDKKYDVRGPDLAFFHNPFPCSLTGLPEAKVENVVLEDITISFPGRGNDGLAIMPLYRLKSVPERASEYPEFSMFGELPSWAWYIRHVSNLTMKNIHVIAREKDFRPAFVFDDVKSLTMDAISISRANNNAPIVFKNVDAKQVQQVKVPGYSGSPILVMEK